MEASEDELFLDSVQVFTDYKHVTYCVDDLITLLKYRIDGATGKPLTVVPLLVQLRLF